jgi:hypothetical protein
MIDLYAQIGATPGGDGSIGSPWSGIEEAWGSIQTSYSSLSDDLTLHLVGVGSDVITTYNLTGVTTNGHSVTIQAETPHGFTSGAGYQITVTGAWNWGLQITQSNLTIRDVEITYNGSYRPNTIIRVNADLSGLVFDGLLITKVENGYYAIGIELRGDETDFRNNLIVYPGQDALVLARGDLRTSNCTVIGNILFQNQYVVGSIHDTYCENYDNTAGASPTIQYLATSDTTGSAGLQNIPVDATTFTDPSNGDYSLASGSPLIGAGAGGEDIGAIPYSGGGGTTYDVSTSDGIGMTDADSGNLSLLMALSDSGIVGDTISGTINMIGSLTDSINISDSASAVALFIGQLVSSYVSRDNSTADDFTIFDVFAVDGWSITDSSLDTIDFNITLAEGVSIGEGLAGAVNYLVSASEGIVFTDISIDSSEILYGNVTLTGRIIAPSLTGEVKYINLNIKVL